MAQIESTERTEGFTEGPWQLETPADYRRPHIVRGVRGIIARVERGPSANAKLIAAAPLMYAALKDMFALMDGGLLVRNISDDGKPGFAMRQLPLVQRLAKASSALAAATDI